MCYWWVPAYIGIGRSQVILVKPFPVAIVMFSAFPEDLAIMIVMAFNDIRTRTGYSNSRVLSARRRSIYGHDRAFSPARPIDRPVVHGAAG